MALLEVYAFYRLLDLPQGDLEPIIALDGFLTA
jgi:hypothetical protein